MFRECCALAAQKFAEAYQNTIFVKFYGNSNEKTKKLIHDLSVHELSATPHFTFWRDGEVLRQHSGASKSKMLAALNAVLGDWDNPLTGANPFKKQVFTSRLMGPSAPDAAV